jgi:hypothetical protein
MHQGPRIGLIGSFVILLSCCQGFAWSHKEHIQFTRIAAQQLIDDPATPSEMKEWLRKALPKPLDMAGEQDYFLHTHLGLHPKGFDAGLTHWAYMPDEHALGDPADSKVQPFNAHERLLHYIDLEYFLVGNVKREYRSDLSSKPAVDNIPHDMHDPRYLQAGYLPFRVEDCYQHLVACIKSGKLHPTNADDLDNAEYWAGYLAHYVADNTQPQHATIDYKSQSYFKNPRKAPNAHAAVEYLMCDDDKSDYPQLRAEFWPLFVKQLETFKDPIETTDPFRATLEVALRSYDALPLIGQAAQQAVRPAGPGEKTDSIDAESFFRYRGTVNGEEMSVMEMKARRTAWGVKRIERIWRQAWEEAKK